MGDVLLVSSGWIHPPYRGRGHLKELLERECGGAVIEVETLEEALQQPLARFVAMVLYYHHPANELNQSQLVRFRGYVDGGGGVLALHSATASYKPSLPYFEVLGGRFTGHGPVSSLEIRPAANADGLFAGIAPFTVHDELYLHQLEPGLQVHFESELEGAAIPVVWTRTVGKGRVCYSCPGHRSASMAHPSVQEIVTRGLRWVSGS